MRSLHRFTRTEWIIGKEALEKLKKSRVAVFGVGGVGSYTVEALARSGVGTLILIDSADIHLTNLNRQIHATDKTIGMPKVEAMKQRIRDINPDAEVITHKKLIKPGVEDGIIYRSLDYIVDAVDMVAAKIYLVQKAKEKSVPIISSMGAGNKLNPAMLEVDDIFKTSVCPLARVMRKELKKRGIDSLKVVYSKEVPTKPVYPDGDCLSDSDAFDNPCSKKLPGSTPFVPPAAGLIIASEVIKDIIGWDKNDI
jgi:tRNA A37 threonylcarbamoyladenosine dehydratase